MSAHHHHHHHHIPEPGTDISADRYRLTKRVTLVGALINVLLSVLKVVFGILGQSQALIADGVHSISDLISDVLVLVAAKHTSKDADANHPYGHGRIETLVTVGLGLFLIAIGGGICIDALRRILEPNELLHPGWLALVVATISIISKEYLYQYTMRIALQFKSKMLRANAWHHRSDAISSVIVLVGVGGSMLGWPYLDAVAAIGVAIMIGKIGWDISFQSVLELVDTGLEPEHVADIRNKIQSIPGVKQLHMLRTRRVGGNALVDVHVQVSPKLSVSEGHYIGEKVRSMLIEEDDEVSDVMVHVDPEDDEKIALSSNLPARNEIESQLRQRWSQIPAMELIEKIVLHYLDGKIHVELLLPLDKLQHPEQAAEIARELARTGGGQHIADIQVLFH